MSNCALQRKHGVGYRKVAAALVSAWPSTAQRVFDRLMDEHAAVGVVSYGMVRDYVATRRREIRIEAGREPTNAFVPKSISPDGRQKSTSAR